MNATIKKFAKEFLEKYACLDTRLSLPLVVWKPTLNTMQKRAVVKEVKRLFSGSVIFNRHAMLPSGIMGKSYLTPTNVFWQGTSVCVEGDIVYIYEQDGKTTLIKTRGKEYIIPDHSVRTIPYNNFAKIFEQMKPTLKF